MSNESNDNKELTQYPQAVYCRYAHFFDRLTHFCTVSSYVDHSKYTRKLLPAFGGGEAVRIQELFTQTSKTLTKSEERTHSKAWLLKDKGLLRATAVT